LFPAAVTRVFDAAAMFIATPPVHLMLFLMLIVSFQPVLRVCHVPLPVFTAQRRFDACAQRARSCAGSRSAVISPATP